MDSEKVIKGLEHCKKYGSLGGNDCNGRYEYTDNLQEIIKTNNHRKDCPYGQCRTGCVVTLVCNAIALLKEQEAKPPAIMQDIEGIWSTCSMCGHKLRPILAMKMDTYFPKFCSECGQAVKWK